MPADITKHPIRGLKGLNRFSSMSDDEIAQLNKNLAIGKDSLPSTDMSEVKPYSLDTGMGSWGTSRYDAPLTFQPMTDDTLLDTRYENQSGLDVLANGVGKALGTAATTFLSSLVGLPAGIVTAIGEQRWSGLWDNDVTNKLGEVDDWLENNMTNYKSRAQEENKWWQNLGTMNFWADDVIKNAGFTLGAAASMAVGAGALGTLSKSLGFVNNVSKGAKMAGAGVSALFSATGEGMIEARNGVEERNKLEMQKLEDALTPERNAIELEKELASQEYDLTGDYATYRRNMQSIIEKEQDLDRRFQAGQQEIEESGKLMGNKILLGNQVLLTAGNLILFGKSIYKSFDRARHVAETASKLGKPFGVTAQRVSNEIKDGFKVVGKNFGRAAASTKGLITEGSEEMNQQWIQNTSGLLEQRKDANDYWKAKLDPDAIKDSSEGMYTLGQAIAQGFNDSWGDIDQWEQFFIGGITGMAGTYMPTKLFNQDKTKARWDPRRYGEWSGGAINEVKEFNKQYNRFNENVDDLNSILSKEDFFERARDFVGHTYTENKKNEALENRDKKTWKDEDDKQIIHDIQAFYRAGKIDDLRAIYDEMGKNLSDDDVQNIIKSSTRETTDDEGKTKYIGAFVDENGNQIVSNDQIREEVKHNSERLNEKLDSYLDSVYYVNQRTGGQLSKDQEDNLAYLHNVSKEKIQRADDIFANRRKDMPEKFLLKTNKSPEQLSKENQSSDLAFTKNEDTPEGYVEVDTSLINDKAYADFFIREVFLGGRRQDGKNISEEEALNAQEQSMVNLGIITDNYMTNYRNLNGTDNDVDTVDLLKDLGDAVALYGEAAQFRDTLEEYMANPGKVDQDKKKEEQKAEKKAKEDNAKNKFEGKSVSEINQAVASGEINADDFDFDDLDVDLTADENAEFRQSINNAKEAVEVQKKAAKVKQIALNIAGEQGIEDISAVIDAVDNNLLSAESTADLNIDNIADFVPEDAYANIDVLDLLSQVFDVYQEELDTKVDIPEDVVEDIGEPPETGDDPVEKVDATSNVPLNSTPTNDVVTVTPSSNNTEQKIVPKNPLTPDALDTIITAMNNMKETPSDGGTWRTNTSRYHYHFTSGNNYYKPYHETIKAQYGENHPRYKRSKAIYEYLTEQGAFDRIENADKDRVKAGETTIHFMVKNFANAIFDKNYEDLDDTEKPQALVVLMLNDNGEVLGDLPLAEYEPTYGKNNETSLVKLLKDTQDKLFKAFEEKRALTNCEEAIADKGLNKDGVENLNLSFNNRKKSPFISKVTLVLNGKVPFINSTNTLNEVIGDANIQLGINVTDGTIATALKREQSLKGILPIRVGSLGQPYLLLPTAAGRYFPVPFYTVPFNALEHSNTELYKFLGNAMFKLVQEASNAQRNPQTFKESMSVIEALLQVEPEEGRSRVVEMNNQSVSVYLQSITDPQNKITITVPNTGNHAEIAKNIVDNLSGTRINVSLPYINKNISLGKTVSYNKVIGEIATVNLPRNTHHSVNTRFIIGLTTESSIKENKVSYPTTGKYTTVVDGRTIEFDTDKLIATEINPQTKEIRLIEDDEKINQMLAEIKLQRQEDKTKPFKITIAGETRTYDPVKKVFIKASEGSSTPRVTAPALDINTQPQAQQQQPESNQLPVLPNTQKTIEEIEKEVADKGIITKQNKDAWEKIPDNIKLKMANERTQVIFQYNNKKVTVSFENLTKMKSDLTNANTAAKMGRLKVTEGSKYRIADTEKQKQANIQKERRWLLKNLPMFNSDERLNLIQGLIEIPGEENKAWGRFKQGIITLSDMAARGTLYHEAFHAVTQTLLSDEELDSLYENAVKRYKESDVALVEELLAEDFRRYVQRGETPIIGPILKFFRKIMNAIRNITNMNDPINQLFYRINNGEFRDTLPMQSRNGNAFYRVYGNKIQENLMRLKDSDAAKPIIDDFVDRNIVGDPYETASQWREFKNYWREQGVRVNGGWAYDALDGLAGYRLKEIYITEGGVEWSAEDLFEAESMMHKEDYAAKLARRGAQLAQEWNRINRSSIQNLEEYQLSKDIWDNMSVREQEQWLKCHS